MPFSTKSLKRGRLRTAFAAVISAYLVLGFAFLPVVDAAVEHRQYGVSAGQSVLDDVVVLAQGAPCELCELLTAPGLPAVSQANGAAPASETGNLTRGYAADVPARRTQAAPRAPPAV